MAKIINGICKEINSNVCLLSNYDASALEFYCGNTQIDNYLKEKAKYDIENVTYIFSDNDTGEIIAFASLRCSGIIFDANPHLELLPAVEIRYFAIAEKFQHIPMQMDSEEERFCISDSVFCKLISIIRNEICNIVGAEYVILYSVPTAVGFYKRNLFTEFDELFTPEQYSYINDCVPMYLTL